MFIGREKELESLNELYSRNAFQLFILYGRRRIGKTTLLSEFCKNKENIFFAAQQDTSKGNLALFSDSIFSHFKETGLSPFTTWSNALTYLNGKSKEKPLVVVIDEFPYIAKADKKILSELQNLIDHTLKKGNLFLILCGSYVSFMETKVLAEKSPLFGRRTGQLKLKSFDYQDSIRFMKGFSPEDKLNLYGAVGGTAQYLEKINRKQSFRQNIKNLYLSPSSYLYEEPDLLLRQEIQEPAVYNAIFEAIASGCSKSGDIANKIGEENAKCIKYLKTLCNLGFVKKEIPFGEKGSKRKAVYSIGDFMFRFWYRYIFSGKTLIETNAGDILYSRKIAGEHYNQYMGLVFETVCREFLLRENALGKLPILFTKIGRWWGSDPTKKQEEEIDIVANDGNEYLFCECKWQNTKAGPDVLQRLKERADLVQQNRKRTYFVLFSKSGFTETLVQEARKDKHIKLYTLADLRLE